MSFDANNEFRKQFPTLVNNPDLAYFDTAATSQTHQSVIDRMNKYYTHERVSVNRGDFPLSSFISEEVEKARASVARLVGAKPHQIAFTSGTTEGLNWIAHWHKDVKSVGISAYEHTSNILPWLAQGRNEEDGSLQVIREVGNESNPETYPELMCITAADNILGNDGVYSFTHYDHRSGNDSFKLAVDMAQVVGHKRVDFENGEDYDAVDFAVFSAHKMYGPTGIGAIYSRKGFDHLDPFIHGGGEVLDYSYNYDTIEYQSGPAKHEGGTPNIAGILGFGVAAEWIQFVGIETIEQAIFNAYLRLSDSEIIYKNELGQVEPDNGCVNIITFNPPDMHPADISAYLGAINIAVRVGKVCSHPQVKSISPQGILRVSIGPYNTEKDLDKLVEGLCLAIQKLT
jgi:cysteine desulfurase/selenocysteine lyase